MLKIKILESRQNESPGNTSGRGKHFIGFHAGILLIIDISIQQKE